MALLGAIVGSLRHVPRSETLLRELSATEADQLKRTSQQVTTTFASLSLVGFADAMQASAFDVVNGKLIRIRPLHYDWQYEPKDFNYGSAEIEVKGQVFQPPLKSMTSYLAQGYKKRIYSPNRVRYPLKRVDWSPAEPNAQTRGISGYARITWDEAISTLVGELKRISATYGPSAILTQAEGHSAVKSLHGGAHFWVDYLATFTGYTRQTRNPDSWEGWWWGAKHAWGMEGGVGMQDFQTNNLLDTMQNSQLLIFWGADLETTCHGTATQIVSVYLHWYAQAGKKCVYICPDGNYSSVIHADKWIPVLPNTDIALHLAIAYVWITEEMYDKEYVATHTLGFDEPSLPAGAPAGSSFKSYVLGLQDGVPKTPKWAEQICGVPSRVIKALARTWAKNRTSIVHNCGGGYIRGPYSSNVARTEVYLLAMQGLGKPGAQQVQLWGNQGNLVSSSLAFGPSIVPTTGAINPYLSDNSSLVIDPPFIPKTLVPDAVLNPPVTWYGRCASISTPVEHQFVKTVFPQEGFSEIHMIWKESGCWIACWNGGDAYLRALRSPRVEFLVQQHPWLENDCLFADLILPVTSVAEDDVDLLSSSAGEHLSVLFLHRAAIPSVGESKSDLEIIELVSEQLGIRNEVVPWASHEEAVKFGFKMSGAANFISWDDFQKKQYWVAPVDPKWAERPTGMTWYWKQPRGSKLRTKSGMIEFYCQGLAEHFPSDQERPVVAHYVPSGTMFQESRSTQKAKRYPYLIVNNHPRWRMHVQGDDITWLREIETCKVRGPDGYQYEPVWIHPVDAAKMGVKQGDIVVVYNDLGAVLGGAYITERIVPGAVSMDHGARLDLISLDPLIDRGGSVNLLTPRPAKWPEVPTTVAEMVVTGYLVDVKKADMQELKMKYPEAFKKKYDPDQGPLSYDTLVRGDDT